MEINNCQYVSGALLNKKEGVQITRLIIKGDIKIEKLDFGWELNVLENFQKLLNPS